MIIKEIIKNIKGVFKLPVKTYYLGKIRYYTPYFEPSNFNSKILFIRKLKLKSPENLEEYLKKYPHFKKDMKSVMFENLPLVRRNKNWTFKIFNTWWHIQIGWPIAISKSGLGWKDKFDSPRHEWNPFWQFWFFKWQFVINWNAPNDNNFDYNDKYWEMILWYLKYSDKDIKKAEETWPWVNYNTKKSTWNKDYLI